jgi:hypothetical protein
LSSVATYIKQATSQDKIIMTSVAISQPTYLPWLGYFQQIANSDYFVFLDNVQFERQSWQSRNRIKDNHDQILWLSVPVKSQALDTPVAEIELAYQKVNWQRKHLNSINTYLAKTPYLKDVVSLLDNVYQQQHLKLADLNIALITALCDGLGIKTKLLRASDMNVSGTKADLLLQIIKKLDGTCYVANQGSRVYLEQERSRFNAQGIELTYQQWSHPIYQQKGQQFVSHLAWPDALAYLGFDAKALQLIELT